MARALLDDPATARLNAPGSWDRIPLAATPHISAGQLLSLLKANERSLLCELRDAMATAASAAATSGKGGKSAGAAAAAAAFEENLDLVVQLGWAHVEARCMGYMLDEARWVMILCVKTLAQGPWVWVLGSVRSWHGHMLRRGALDTCWMRQGGLSDAVRLFSKTGLRVHRNKLGGAAGIGTC